MPALETVLFTGTHADAYIPTYNGNGVWTLYAPDNAESCIAQSSTNVDLHQDITLPSSTYGFIIVPHTLASGDIVPRTGLHDGTGTAQSLYLNVLNASVGNLVPAAGTAIAFLIISKDLYKATQS